MNISGHALQRMLERGFTAEMLQEFLAGEFCNKKSDKQENVVLLIGMVKDKFWTIVVNCLTDNMITVRRSHIKEIKDYVSRRH